MGFQYIGNSECECVLEWTCGQVEHSQEQVKVTQVEPDIGVTFPNIGVSCHFGYSSTRAAWTHAYKDLKLSLHLCIMTT